MSDWICQTAKLSIIYMHDVCASLLSVCDVANFRHFPCVMMAGLAGLANQDLHSRTEADQSRPTPVEGSGMTNICAKLHLCYGQETASAHQSERQKSSKPQSVTSQTDEHLSKRSFLT